jgi:mycofactocin glycosyltransferase
VTAAITVVVPVWDEYANLLPRCLRAIAREQLPTVLVIADNASEKPIDVPSSASRVTLTTRATIGAARNAGLEHVDTPFVVFADADDEIAPDSLRRSLALLERHPRAAGVIGRSLVDEDGECIHRGRRPTTLYRVVTRAAPPLVPTLWLAGFQGSITSTVLRTRSVREAGGFADANVAEDWQLAARLARRGSFICIDDPVRIYHRHQGALRIREARDSSTARRRSICADCRVDPASTRLQRWAAAALMSRGE